MSGSESFDQVAINNMYDLVRCKDESESIQEREMEEGMTRLKWIWICAGQGFGCALGVLWVFVRLGWSFSLLLFE